MHAWLLSTKRIVAFAGLAALAACSKGLDGPKPEIEAPAADADPPPVDPEIICRDQLRSEVTLHGERFSPVPIDLPGAPKVALPDVTLVRSHALDGSSVTDPDEVTFSGDPDADPTNAVDAAGDPRVLWTDQTELRFVVDQELTLSEAGDTGMLEPGVWDVRVENANGHSIDSLKSLAVVDKPEVAEHTPGIVCLDQGAVEIALSGQSYLRNEQRRPVLEVEGTSQTFDLALSDCTAIDHAGADAELCRSASAELPEGAVAVGFPAITVRNPQTAACGSTEDIKLRVVPAPTLDRVVEPLACVAQGERSFVLEGEDFLRIDGTYPRVAVGAQDFEVQSADGCEALDTQGHDVERCSSLTITVAEDALDPGLYDVLVVNPDPAGCEASASGVLRIAPPPAMLEVEPPLVCLDGGERSITVRGSDFLVVAGVSPSVSVDGEALDADAVAPEDCDDLEVDGLSVQRCDSLVLTLAQAGVDVGMPEVTVTNPAPAGCSDQRSDLLTVAPGPQIASAAPALLCTDDGSKIIAITGTGFLKIGSELPAVNVGGSAVSSVDAVDGCTELTVNGLDVETCTEIEVTVAQGALAAGRPEVEVINPDPAGCSAASSTVLTVPPMLAVSSLQPLTVCQDTVDSAFAVTLIGDGFLQVGTDAPSLTFNSAAITPVTLSGCTALEVAGASDVSSCTQIDATLNLTATETGTVGALPIAVTNAHVPECALSAMATLTVVAPPTVTGVDVAEVADPNNPVCSDIAFTLVVTGTGFVEGSTVTLSNDNGIDVVADSVVIDSATQLTATFTNGLPYGADSDFDLVVATAGSCDSQPTLNVIDVQPTPIVFFVDPPVVYNGITIDATVFTSGISGDSQVAAVELVDSSQVATTLELLSSPDEDRIIARIPGIDPDTSNPTFASGDYAVRVTSELDCQSEISGQLAVTDTLNNALLTAIDPSFVSPTESTPVTVTGSGFSPLPRLYLTPDASQGAAVALRAVEIQASNSLTGVIPASLEAPLAGNVSLLASGGTYPTSFAGNETLVIEIDGTEHTVTFADGDEELSHIVTAINNLVGDVVASAEHGELKLESLVVGPSSQVAVTSGTGAATLGFSTPVEVVAEDVVYDLVLVAPNGEVAVLDKAVTAVINDPPRIATVVPASLPASSTGTLTIEGSGFDTAGVEVELDCLSGTTRTTIAGTEGTVSAEGTSVDVTFTISVSEGSVCLVRLQNGDGAFFEYSAFSVTNASLNLQPWSDATSMTIGRRGLALAAGRPTETSRFLYAIGGDSGTASDPFARGAVLTSVESANVDVFGVMGSWSLQRNDLSAVVIADTPTSAGRTQAGVARVGQFVYLTGGHDGTSATSSVLRAKVLDPLTGPEIVDLDAQLGDVELDTGLEGGLYYYRVAAIFPSDDADNPGGESLAGELLPVQLPDREDKIVLTLSWQEVAGAHGYRIYRSPAADASADALELLAELTCGTLPTDVCDCAADATQCSLSDDGLVDTMAGVTPMPSGSLGVWHAVDGTRCADADCALGTAREGHVSVAIRDRSETDPASDTYYLYAIGGRDGAGTYLDSYEIATMTVDLTTGEQVVSDWAAGADTLQSPRADLAAWVMDAENAAVIRNSGSPDDVWVYVGGGRTAAGTADRNMEAGLLAAGGDLGSFMATDDLSGDLIGLGAGSANGQLVTFGGQSTANGTSAQLCAGGGGCGPLPDLQPGAFNALGAAQTDRMFMGYTQESAFFFLAGGHDGVNTLETTEQTVQ